MRRRDRSGWPGRAGASRHRRRWAGSTDHGATTARASYPEASSSARGAWFLRGVGSLRRLCRQPGVAGAVVLPKDKAPASRLAAGGAGDPTRRPLRAEWLSGRPAGAPDAGWAGQWSSVRAERLSRRLGTEGACPSEGQDRTGAGPSPRATGALSRAVPAPPDLRIRSRRQPGLSAGSSRSRCFVGPGRATCSRRAWTGVHPRPPFAQTR